MCLFIYFVTFLWKLQFGLNVDDNVQAGESLMLRLPTTDIVSAMLTSLTMLALNSIFTIERQVEFL